MYVQQDDDLNWDDNTADALTAFEGGWGSNKQAEKPKYQKVAQKTAKGEFPSVAPMQRYGLTFNGQLARDFNRETNDYLNV